MYPEAQLSLWVLLIAFFTLMALQVTADQLFEMLEGNPWPYGHIPELDMSSYNLADRLKRNFRVTLAEVVEDVEDGLGA